MALSLMCKKFLRLTPPGKCLRSLCSAACEESRGLVLGAYYNEDLQKVELTNAAAAFDETALKGQLLEQIILTGNKIKQGKSILFWGLHRDFTSIAVVGLGKQGQTYNDEERICEEKESVRIAASVGCRVLNEVGIKDIYVESFNNAEQAAEGSLLSTWKFQEYRTKKEKIPKVSLFKTCPTDEEGWESGVIKATAQNVARRLSDMPSNKLTPEIFAEEACRLVKGLNITVEAHDKYWARQQNMEAFLAVSRGSQEPPVFLELSYGNNTTPPYVLVGKGVTFDSGGISLKPAASMGDMRADMSGAACVLATVYALARLHVPVNVKVLIPLVENMPSAMAVKPGDVVTAKNGKTICIDNTDAEGRLILADALTYSSIYKPKWVLDVATLTGAMVVALGGAATGVYSNCYPLYKQLELAGANAGDRVWLMPLWKEYTKALTKNQAYDINNISDSKGGGSCTAAAFLREFIPKDTNWMHLDIAGVMGPNTDGMPYLGKGMTGRPTRTLIEFIQAEAKARSDLYA